MAEALIQKAYNWLVWNTRTNLNDPNTPINGTTVGELLGGGTGTEAGENVSERTALNFASIFRANRLLCDLLAYLPVNVIENNKDGSKAVAKSHPAQFLLHKEPNDLHTSFTWREAGQADLNFHGNTYSEKIIDGGGNPIRFDFLRDENVQPKIKGRDLVYVVTNEDLTKRVVRPDRMIHVPGFGFNGIEGMSVIDIARESYGAALAAQNYGGRFFGNSATPSGMLINKGATKDQAKEAKASWQKTVGGKKQQGTAVMPGSWEYQQISITPEQAQFLGTRSFSVLEIARWFGIPPHLLFELERATFNNIEELGISFLIYTLNGWVNRYQQEWNRKLFTRAERREGRFETKFNINAILQSDIKSRADFYRTLWAIAGLSTNDILELEDRNKVEGGDQRWVQMGFAELKDAAEIAKGRTNQPSAQPNGKVKANGQN